MFWLQFRKQQVDAIDCIKGVMYAEAESKKEAREDIKNQFERLYNKNDYYLDKELHGPYPNMKKLKRSGMDLMSKEIKKFIAYYDNAKPD